MPATRVRRGDHLGRRHRALLGIDVPYLRRSVARACREQTHHPDSVPQRGVDAAGDTGGSAARRPGHRRGRGARHRRRLARTARRRSPAPAASITSSGCAATRGWRRRSRPGSTPRSSAGADFIVNTDADNQYAAHDIPRLLAPLLRGEADIVIGDRNIGELRHMSWRKRQLQRLGSWVVRQVSNTTVPDTTSGFRAYTREAALRMTIVSEFSYTLESIIQAGKKRMAIAHVPVATNPRTRDVAPVRQRLRLHQAIGGDHRPHLRDVRAAEGLHLYRAVRVRPRPRDLGAVRLLLHDGHRLGAPSVAHRLGRADDRRASRSSHRPARRRDLGAIASCSKTCCTGCARSNCRRRATRPTSDDRHPRPQPGPVGALVADPSSVSVVVPAYHEGGVIAEVVAALAAAGPWHEIIVVDDGSADDDRGARRGGRRAGRPASVQQGQRRGRQERHPPRHRRVRPDRRRRRPAPAGRRQAPGRPARRVRSGDRRALERRRRPRRRGALGNCALNRLAELSDRAGHPGPDVGLPGGAPRAPARVPAPAAERVLDADDDDAGVHQGGLQRGVRAGRGAAARRARPRSGWPATARSS